jgi:hypothetical protein
MFLRFGLRRVAFAWLLVTLSACAPLPPEPDAQAMPASPLLQFLDLQSFDRDLSRSLTAALPAVEVAFHDRVTPSAMPERLQKWMASVEAGGGSVKVIPPPSSVTARNPLMLVSALTTLWSAGRMAQSVAQDAQFKAAQTHDAEIRLKTDDKGQTVVDRVVFFRRAKP